MAKPNTNELTMEQIEKAMACETAEELMELAKAEGIELTKDEAEAYLAEMADVEFTDATLKQAAGGGRYQTLMEIATAITGDIDLSKLLAAVAPNLWKFLIQKEEITMKINPDELSKEQIEKAMACKTAEELMKLAKAEGFEMTKDEAEAYLTEMDDVELADEELQQVAGGTCWVDQANASSDRMKSTMFPI